jgi:hypothetical protein
MSQIVSCPHCKQAMQLPPGLTAAQVRCPGCKLIFTVPAVRPAVAAVPASAGNVTGVRGALAPCSRTQQGANAPRSPSNGQRGETGTTPPSWLDFRQWPTPLRLAPAGLLAFILLLFMIRDRFVGGETSEEEPETVAVELPVDPDPLLALKFQEANLTIGTLRFGLIMRKETDDNGRPKRLTFAEDGDTNNAVVSIDGDLFLFGKFAFGTGGSGRKGEHGGFTVDPTKELPILRGRLIDAAKPLPAEGGGRPRIGQSSLYRYDESKIEVTQTVEIVPGKQVSPGQTHRHLDTCLVRYRLDNRDQQPHRLGFRFVLDTFIGGNDGVPFTISGSLCDTSKDFALADQVPDFLQALERPNLTAPGTVAHLTLRLGGRLEPPNRVTLGHWINQLQWRVFQTPHVDWQFPIAPIADDSCVVLYWDAKEVPAGGHRELGFAYGLGHISSSEGDGQLGLTVGGSFRPGEEFMVTAYVHEPLPKQTASLELPRGLTRVEGEATQDVPPLPADAKSRNSPVTWKVKAARPGRYTLRVQTNNGLRQSQTVTVTSTGIFD